VVERARPRRPLRCVARVRPVAASVGASRGSGVGAAVGASVATAKETVGGGAIPERGVAGRGVAMVERDDNGGAVAGTVQGARTLWPPTW